MRRTMWPMTLLAMYCLVGVRLASAQAPMPPAPPPVITAVGHAETHIAPDRATIAIMVETRAPTAAAAATANARATTSTLAALHGIGLTDADLSTTGFSVGMDYMRPPVNGVQPPVTFVARNGVRVNLTTLAKLGRVIDTALAAGATQVGQAQFTSSHMEEARVAALTQAVEHARADATTIAHAAGGTLGALIEVTTPGSSFGGTYYEQMLASSGPSIRIRGASDVAGGMAAPPPPTPLAPGDVSVAVTLTARWQFVPGH